MITFGTVANVAGALVTSNLVGELAVLVGDLNRNQARYEKKVDNANQAMLNLALPTEIQNLVLTYMKNTKAGQDYQSEYRSFFSFISPSLQSQVTRTLFTLICRNSVLIGPHI
jgi:hypothetical protein